MDFLRAWRQRRDQRRRDAELARWRALARAFRDHQAVPCEDCKAYIESLEQQNSTLRRDNKTLDTELTYYRSGEQQ